MSKGKSLILASVLFLLFSFITEGALAQEFSYAHATVITPKGVPFLLKFQILRRSEVLGLEKEISWKKVGECCLFSKDESLTVFG